MVGARVASGRAPADLPFLDGVRARPFAPADRARARCPLGAARVNVRAEGGHYTFIEVDTDQMGESRLDRNVKRFFLSLHREEDPRHVLEAAY